MIVGLPLSKLPLRLSLVWLKTFVGSFVRVGSAMEKHLKAGAAQISFAVATIVLGVVINRLTL